MKKRMKTGEKRTGWQRSGAKNWRRLWNEEDLKETPEAGGHAKSTGAGGAGTLVTSQRGQGSKVEGESTRMVYMLLWWKTLKI